MFNRFLRNHDSLQTFNFLVEKHYGYAITVDDYLRSLKDISFAIASAFEWYRTMEGVDYWKDLSDQWQALVNGQ